LGNGHLKLWWRHGVQNNEKRTREDDEEQMGRDMNTTTCLPGGAPAFDAQVGRHTSDDASGCCCCLWLSVCGRIVGVGLHVA
jgi:hypothetical protein